MRIMNKETADGSDRLYNFRFAGLGACLLILMMLLVFVAPLLFAGCDDAKSQAKKIVWLKNERREMIDKLYAEYGGSDLAKAVKEEVIKDMPQDGGEDEASRAIGDFARHVDRRMFKDRVMMVGEGERLPFMTDKARAFFTRPDIIEKCKKVYELEMEIQILECRNPNR
ncbi:MAG: hypothetical protein ACOWYE_09820 [Desulfatiglandales bacterium]